MSEIAKQPSNPAGRWQRWYRQLAENPITQKELRSRMRGARAFVVLTGFLVLMSAFVLFTYLIVVLNDSGTSNSNRTAGQAIFITLVTVQTFLVLFIAPAFTSGAISGEKERQTFELLKTTLLSPKAFVFGKLASALSYVFLLVLAAVPLISLAFMLGGITPSEVIISQLLLLSAAIAYATIGLYFSSSMRSTMGASVATYVVILIFNVGIPVVYGFGLGIFASLMFNASSFVEDMFEMIFALGGMFLSMVNLPAAMVLSDLVFREGNALFWYFDPGTPYPIIAPWSGFLLIQLLITWFYFRRTVKKVGKVADS
ncbi:MAG: ABC transporter permease [Ardenticatenaceae bacterium]|nr:ABC transporter permease [Ardenticatenaceae bacterium]